jgi:hypothetical protein
MTPPRLVATALAVACTGALLLLLRAAHPPAMATTLIVSLGVLLTVVSRLINRACGVRDHPPGACQSRARGVEGLPDRSFVTRSQLGIADHAAP